MAATVFTLRCQSYLSMFSRLLPGFCHGQLKWDDYSKAEQHIYHAPRQASFIELPLDVAS
jgi:hypothetical protein